MERLIDPSGPQARHRTLVVSAASAAVLAVLAAGAVRRLAQRGQLDADRWELFFSASVLRYLVGGLAVTLQVALMAIMLALLLGVATGVGRVAPRGAVRWAARSYVELFRGLPVLLLLFLTARALPRLGIDAPPMLHLVLALALVNGALLGEIVRAGILAVGTDQIDAAKAIGLTDRQILGAIILPQAGRAMAPALVSQLVSLLKDTSLGFVLPVEELLRRGQITGEYSQSPLQAAIVVGTIFVAVNVVLGLVARRLEAGQRHRGGQPVSAAGNEELVALTVRPGGRGSVRAR